MSNEYIVNEKALKKGEYIDPVSGVIRSKGPNISRTKEEMEELFIKVPPKANDAYNYKDSQCTGRVIEICGVVIVENPMKPKGGQWSLKDAKVAKKMELVGSWGLYPLELAIKRWVNHSGSKKQ